MSNTQATGQLKLNFFQLRSYIYGMLALTGHRDSLLNVCRTPCEAPLNIKIDICHSGKPILAGAFPLSDSSCSSMRHARLLGFKKTLTKALRSIRSPPHDVFKIGSSSEFFKWSQFTKDWLNVVMFSYYFKDPTSTTRLIGLYERWLARKIS